MKKSQQILALVLLFTSGAALSANNAPEILSWSTFSVHGMSVNLPKTKDSDGIVCQSYVKTASLKTRASLQEGTNHLEPLEEVVVTFGQFCGKGVVIPGQDGRPDEIYPEGLMSMKWHTTSDGLGIHLLNVERKGN